MSLSSWKQFSFLHYSPIRDPNFNTETPLFSDPSISAICSSDKYIMFAIASSIIKIVDLEFNLVYQFVGFEPNFTISYLKHSQVNNMNVICAVGESSGVPTVLKLWNLDKLMESNNSKTNDYSHHYLTSVNVQNGTNQFPLSTFAISDDFSVSAFGFTNGSTILVRGNLLNDKGARQRIIYESSGEPITGAHLFLSSPTSGYYLYVLTTSKILLFDTTGRNQNTPLNVLENTHGSNLFCNDILSSNSNLISCDSNGNSIDFYNSKFGKVNSIKTSKQFNQNRLFNFNDKYLLMVSSMDNSFTKSVMNDNIEDTSSPAGSIFKFNPSSTSGGNSEFKTTKIMVIDYTHNFIIFNLTISHNITNVINVANDGLYLLSSNGIFYKLQEKSINDKIQILIQRDLYPMAIQLAEEELAVNNPASTITKKDLFLIKKKYGDYLYDKGDFQESIGQYIDSINLKNNSFNLNVILKFKNNDKILYLTEYLEHLCFSNKEIFERHLIKYSSSDDLINEDYLTLLLCNYCKLKDIAKFQNFIDELEAVKQKYADSDEEQSLLNYSNLNFNLDLIISLLLKIDFNKVVINISFIFKYYSMILDILINKFQDFKMCIIFLRFLRVNEIFNLLLTESTQGNYIKRLLHHVPIETTKLLIDIFTGIYRPTISEEYIHEQFNNLKDGVTEHHHQNSSSINDIGKDTDDTNLAIQSYNTFVDYISSTANNTLTLMNFTDSSSINKEEDQQPTYQPPKPRLVFISFIDNPNEFVVFLEAILENYDKFDRFNTNVKDKTDLLITLFEMYLSLANMENNKQEWEQKAMSLYQKHKTLMDYNTVLLLCHLNDFSDEDLLLSLGGEVENEENQLENDQHTGEDRSSEEARELKNERTKSREENLISYNFDMEKLLDEIEDTLPDDHPTLIIDEEYTGENHQVSASNKIELLRSSLNSQNIEKSVEILNKYGPGIPEMYSMTLFYVIKKNSEEFLTKKFGVKNLMLILIKLLKSNVLSVIDLVNIVSLNDLVKFKYLKNFLMNYLEFKTSEIEKNDKLFDYYSKEIETKKSEISKLLVDHNESGDSNDQENVIVVNNLKCHLCGLNLDFPIVHFYCQHSYHQRCLNDFEYDSYNEDLIPSGQLAGSGSKNSTNFKCPKCISEMEAVSNLRMAQDEIGEKNDLFRIALDESEDKFKVINDFFGRGAMEHSRFIMANNSDV
ncbi:tethering complex subunit [Saccharomycopsis crataegensis]|uniref:Tethering complex subunit n=1 Tax=Saccharomycopsis crataegensis TaxID=43959 RepID=A0AAV5QVT0_9ASCO|nr:tethering complex subunit [Saccharomycopsis crataegensis]